MVSSSPHLLFNLVFEADKYLKAFSLSEDTIDFSFSLSYKTDAEEGGILGDCLSSCEYSAANTRLSYNHSETFGESPEAFVSSDGLSISKSDSSYVYYLTLDYSFDVSESFSEIKENELTQNPTFVLKAEVIRS